MVTVVKLRCEVFLVLRSLVIEVGFDLDFKFTRPDEVHVGLWAGILILLLLISLLIDNWVIVLRNVETVGCGEHILELLHKNCNQLILEAFLSILHRCLVHVL